MADWIHVQKRKEKGGTIIKHEGINYIYDITSLPLNLNNKPLLIEDKIQRKITLINGFHNRLHHIMAGCYLQIIDLYRHEPRFIDLGDSFKIYDEDHNEILIAYFTQTGFSIHSTKNCIIVDFRDKKLVITSSIKDLLDSKSILLITGLLMDIESQTIDFYTKTIKREMKPHFKKLPFDH